MATSVKINLAVDTSGESKIRAMGNTMDATAKKASALQKATSAMFTGVGVGVGMETFTRLLRFMGEAMRANKAYAAEMGALERSTQGAKVAIGGFMTELLGGSAGLQTAASWIQTIARFIGVDLVIAIGEVRARFSEFVGSFLRDLATIASGLSGGVMDTVMKKLTGTSFSGVASMLGQMARDQFALATAQRAASDAAAIAAQKNIAAAGAQAQVAKTAKEAADKVLQLGHNLRISEKAAYDFAHGAIPVASDSIMKLTLHDMGRGQFGRDLHGGQQGGVVDGTKAATAATIDWRNALSDVANMFTALPGVAGNVLSMVAGGIASIGAHLARLKEQGGLSSLLSGSKESGGIGGIFAGIGGMLGIGGAVLGIGKSIFGALFGGNDKAAEEARRTAEEMQRMLQSFLSAQGGLDGLRGTAERAGVSLDGLFNAKNAQQLEATIKRITTQIATWNEAQQLLNKAMETYGFTVEDLGDKFKQQRLDERGVELLGYLRILEGAGVDHDKVMEKMSGDWIEYFNTIIRSGATVPEALRPILQWLIDNGKLLNGEGTPFKSIEETGIVFTKDLPEAIDGLIKKLDELVRALLGLPNIERTITYTVVNPPDPDPVDGGGWENGYPKGPPVSPGSSAGGGGSNQGFMGGGGDTFNVTITSADPVIVGRQIDSLRRRNTGGAGARLARAGRG